MTSPTHSSRLQSPSLPRWTPLALAIAVGFAPAAALAQSPAPDTSATDIAAVEVVGSRIRKSDAEGAAPVLTLQRQDIERTGLNSIGEVLQQLTAGGRALNGQFNSSGNSGAPPDGGGIGAGSAQVDLRHLESKRVLVLVDGKRWVNETSGSGIGGSVDLNTIPLAIVERIEVLGDGASTTYGSDAIAGVVNIVTRRNFTGTELRASAGGFGDGDGDSTRIEATWGRRGARFNGVLSASFQEQQRVDSSDRDLSDDFPAGVTRGSPVTPQGRFIFVPTFATPPGLCPPTVDVNGDGIPDVPLCDLSIGNGTAVAGNGAAPFPGGFRRYTDDQSFNAQPFNLLLTPNRRQSLFAAGDLDLGGGTRWVGKALWNRRESVNQAAANVLVVGPEAPGNGLADRIGISRLNPFNPFGVDLVPGANMFAIARRPLEGGPRIFTQDVETFYASTGLDGAIDTGERQLYWDVNVLASRSTARQTFQNSYNMRRVQLALGDPAICAQNPGCVPLNLFGGQGADGRGTLTPEMLGWIRTEVNDSSRQDINAFTANISGDAFALPAGMASFATGVEHRAYEGRYTPDAQRTEGVITDLASSSATRGSYEVSEAYAEFSLPLLRDRAFAKRLDLSIAGRYSHYSNFGDVSTGKLGVTWQTNDALLLRTTYSEGFRAPFIGELFGLSQFGASIKDPCSGFAASGNATLIAQCQALGVPASYRQNGFQVFTTTGGNIALEPETSDSLTAGLVYSPGWLRESALADRVDIELGYYRHTVKDAIQAPNAQDVLNACVASGSATSLACNGITRLASGSIGAFDNRLANIGRIRTDGLDLGLAWSLETAAGGFTADWRTTYVRDYDATDAFGRRFTRTVGVLSNDGSIPEFQSNLRLGWQRGAWEAGWTLRYVDALTEPCSDQFDNTPISLTSLGVCSAPDRANPALSKNRLGALTYHDLFIGWNDAIGTGKLQVALTINNAFDKAPGPCFSCALNGYDPGTYDVPGRFWNLQAVYRFD